MKTFWTICKFHIRGNFRSTAFKIISAIMLLLNLGFYAFNHYSNDDSKKEFSVVSKTQQYKLTDQGDFTFKTIKESELQSEKEKLKKGKVKGIVVIDKKDLEPVVTYYYNNQPNVSAIGIMQVTLQSQYQSAVIDKEKIEDHAAQALLKPVELQMENVNNSKMMGLVYVFAMFMYIFILTFGQMIAQGIAAEKASRVMEILITKAKPIAIMYAKIISTMVAGLVQIVIVAGAFVTAKLIGWISSDKTSIFSMPIDLSFLSVKMLSLFMVYFILGFILYAMLFAAASSFISRIEDLGTILMPIILLLVAALFIAMQCMSNPTSTIVRVSSYIPLFSPVVTFSRMTMGEAPWYEIVITIAELILCIAILLRVSTKMFVSGVMHYGKKMNLIQAFKNTKNNR
jgi:ABC-2 type transport system permease protein